MFLVAGESILPYLDEWKANVASRKDFTAAQRRRMQLSSETLLGIRRTSKFHCFELNFTSTFSGLAFVVCEIFILIR